MLEFFDILGYTFWRNALYTGLLASVLFGVIGTYVVIKRIVFISGGIAHASFGGIGFAFYVGMDPLLGAAIFALFSAVGIGQLGKKKIQREDTAIGIFWVIGMALGAMFYRITPGNPPGMHNYLFGNIFMIRTVDIYLLLFLVLGVVITVSLFYHKLQAVSFDEEFAEVVGIRTTAIYLMLLVLVALSVVLLLTFVGIILVIAMLTIPASISNGFTHDIKRIMIYSCLLSLIFVIGGLWLSYLVNTPAGPTITLLAGAFFVGDVFRKKFKKAILS
ncbi:MAG: metal ABC transporter permease [Candidatus Aenigmatarchaeota archaeon]